MGNITITYGYDKHQRLWAILVQDKEGNTIDSEYCGDKKWCESSIEFYKKKYNTTKVVKYKAY